MYIPVDALLKEWQSLVTTISKNLMELSEQTEIKLIKLKIKDTSDGFTGLTKQRAEKAVDDLGSLWRYYAILSGAVERAGELYSKNSFLHNTEDEVRELLERTPIILETERIDISSRGLITPENKNTNATLQELLKLMQESFENTRNTFTEVSNAYDAVRERLKDMKDEIENLNNTARTLGLNGISHFDIPEIAAMEGDPLKGLKDLDTLYRKIEQNRTLIRSAETDYNEIVNSLNRSSGMLCDMEETAEKSQNAIKLSKQVFGDIFEASPIIDKNVLESLKDWLHVIEDKLHGGSISAAKIGAKRLESECVIKLDTEKRNFENNVRDYNELQDFKGQFSALMVKYEGLKSRGRVFENSMGALIEDIKCALNCGSVNLNAVRGLVEKFSLSLKG